MTYASRATLIDLGFGSLAACGFARGASSISSSMISWQRLMHSSQMYTPWPAISLRTCSWLLPQKLQRYGTFGPLLVVVTRLDLSFAFAPMSCYSVAASGPLSPLELSEEPALPAPPPLPSLFTIGEPMAE